MIIQFVCIFSGFGASASGAFNQPPQIPGAVTPPPPHQPVVGLAQAQTNNSNNKKGTSMNATVNNMPEDLQGLMDDWAQEVLIVTHRPRTDSLSIYGQQQWDQVGLLTHDQPASASVVSFIICSIKNSTAICHLALFLTLCHFFQASSWTTQGPVACTLSLTWPDSTGTTVMTSPSSEPHHAYQLHSPAPFRALPSPLSFNQWPGYFFPVPSRVFGFPAGPSTQSSPISAPSQQLTDPKAKTL